ncbi:hypothetical protein HDV05_006405 [Chytridiales sp. JEL 0842]|nr:hypothetical protein HDV05_006405 [Chytridiales sp. JEL 0842]
MALSQLAPFKQYLNPAWIDFRVQVSNSSYAFDPSVANTATVIWAMYVAQCWVLPLVFLFGAYLFYYKAIRTRIFPWSVIDGALVPRGPELFIMFSSIFAFLQWMYAIMIIYDALPSYLAKEFFFEIKWGFLYIASTSYIFSLIHATPKGTSSTSSKKQESFLPSATWLNISYAALSSLGLFPLAFSIVSGIYADLGDDSKAAFYVSAHYLSWTLTLVVFTTVLVFFGWQLVSMLKVNMRQLSSSNNSSKGANSSANAVSGVSNEKMRKAVISLLVTVLCLATIAVIFVTLLGLYAFLRKEMHSNPGINILCAALWLFNSPLLMTAIYCGIYWITFHKGPTETSENASQMMDKRTLSQMEFGDN